MKEEYKTQFNITKDTSQLDGWSISGDSKYVSLLHRESNGQSSIEPIIIKYINRAELEALAYVVNKAIEYLSRFDSISNP